MGSLRSLLALALVAGCASARSFGSDDAPAQSDAASTDAKVFLDARQPAPVDAAIADAPKPDAKVFLDAAEPIDAAKPPPDACVPQTTQLLLNEAFDNTPIGSNWTQVPVQNTVCNGTPCGPFPLISNNDAMPNSPPEQAFLGGLTGEDVNPQQQHVSDELYQDVEIPAGTTKLVLSGFYLVGSTEDPADPTVYDTGTVELLDTGGAPIENVMSLSNVTAATMTAYTAFTHTFTANVAGQTVRVFFTSTNDIINNTNFFFDTLKLEATHCP